MKTKSFTSIKPISNYLSKMVRGLRTPHESRQFSKPVFDVIDIEIKMTVITGDDVKKTMFDGILSDETLLMVYRDLEREIKNGDNTRSKSQESGGKTA